MILADETEPEKAPEEKMKENKAEKHKESADEGKGEKKNILRCGSSCGLLSIMDWRKIFLRLSQRFWRTACRGNGILRRVRYGGSDADRPACGDGKGVFPEAAKNVVWKYIEPSYKLRGKDREESFPSMRYTLYCAWRQARRHVSSGGTDREESTMNDDARKRF